jgi:hypothetical protein
MHRCTKHLAATTTNAKRIAGFFLVRMIVFFAGTEGNFFSAAFINIRTRRKRCQQQVHRKYKHENFHRANIIL